MKHFVLMLLIFCKVFPDTPTTSLEVLNDMAKHYKADWCRSLDIEQVTDTFVSDTLYSTQQIHLSIAFPDLERLVFNDASGSGYILRRNDSAYWIKNKKLLSSSKEINETTLFLCGIYTLPVEQIILKFKALHYDLSKFHSSTWKGVPVYVVGADNDGDRINQIWIDKEKLVAIRSIKYFGPNGSNKIEMLFEDHIAVKKSWCPTKCSTYLNNSLLQIDTYENIKGDSVINMKVFEPVYKKH